jgi:predicted small secreted protein
MFPNCRAVRVGSLKSEIPIGPNLSPETNVDELKRTIETNLGVKGSWVQIPPARPGNLENSERVLGLHENVGTAS